jgi:hypothetical protein
MDAQRGDPRYTFFKHEAIWDTRSLIWRLARQYGRQITYRSQWYGDGRLGEPDREVVCFDGRRTMRDFYRLRKAWQSRQRA